jgi:Flp pilus assembly protein TadB
VDDEPGMRLLVVVLATAVALAFLQAMVHGPWRWVVFLVVLPVLLVYVMVELGQEVLEVGD